jgi:tetratricopeptide (TPR) repeat protein
MSHRIQCNNCGVKINVPDDWTRPRAHCPRCKATLFLPEQTLRVAAEAPALSPATGGWRLLAIAATSACVRLGRLAMAQARETAAATADQTKRMVRLGLAYFRHGWRRRQEAAALSDLGDQLARQGLGDAAIRGGIADLDWQTLNGASGNGPTAQCAAERKVLTGRLAASWLDSGAEAFPTEFESQRNGAILVRSNRIAADQELAAARAAVWPRERAPLLRAVFGWGVVAGIFGLLILASLGRTPRGQSEPAVVVAAGPSDRANPGGVGKAAFTSPNPSGARRRAGGNSQRSGLNGIGLSSSKELGDRVIVPIEASPAEPSHEQAKLLLEQGEYARAISACDEALRRDPRFHLAYFTRGVTHSMQAEYQRAVADMTHAIQLAPNIPPYFANRAGFYIQLHKLDLAIADCNKAIGLDNQCADAYGHRGIAFSGKGDQHRALKDFNVSIRLDPTVKEPWNNRAAIWNDRGEFDRAIADCNEAIRLDPGYVSAWNNRAHAYGKKGDLDKAVADASEAIRLDPSHQFARGNRGLFWLQKHEFDKAIADLNEAIRLDPSDAAAFANRGLCYRGKGDEARAQVDFARYRALTGARP